MKGRAKARKGASKVITRDHTLEDQSQESTGSTAQAGSAYGMAKGPSQKMAGAAKKATAKIRRMRGY